MEEKVFPRPAVAGVLKEKFVEARLHTDGGPSMKSNVERQDAMARSRALPNYLVVDPQTGAVLRQRAGAMTESAFLDVLGR